MNRMKGRGPPPAKENCYRHGHVKETCRDKGAPGGGGTGGRGAESSRRAPHVTRDPSPRQPATLERRDWGPVGRLFPASGALLVDRYDLTAALTEAFPDCSIQETELHPPGGGEPFRKALIGATVHDPSRQTVLMQGLHDCELS